MVHAALQFTKAKQRRLPVMSKMCAICGKKPLVGSNISHAHNVTKRRFDPNLQSVRALHDGQVKKLMVCTQCIKSGNVVKAP
jgi:large subunit ribosomal protein L28